MRHDATGLFFEVELERHAAYIADVLRLIERGALGFSTGALAHLVERAGGTVKRWIIGELSLTPTPCEPRCLGVRPIDHRSAPTAQSAVRRWMDTTASTHTEGVLTMSDAHNLPGAVIPTVEDVTMLDSRVDEMHERLAGLETALKAALDAPARPRGLVVPGDARRELAEQTALKVFNRYIRTGIKAALQENTPGEGGYLVPPLYSSQLAAALRDMSVLRQAGARVINVQGTNSFKVPTMTHTTAAVLTAEEGDYSEIEPTFNQITFTPFKYTRLAKVSDELLADSGIDVVSSVLLPDFAQAFAAAENSAFATGTGSSQPQGVVTGATAGSTATSGTFVADDIIKLYHALPAAYRQRAVWLVNDAIAQIIRTFKETTTGNYLWQPGLQSGTPDRLLGRPVYTLNTMDNAVTANKNILLFGDLSFYWIVDFGQEALKRLEELYAATGQVGFRAYRRMDARVMVGEAIQVLRVKA
ncbi:MAG: phage major capsid protein [Chloroflexaceae bacterium]|nr:phage major capsid protein [Chloroflexaceae bacterium]